MKPTPLLTSRIETLPKLVLAGLLAIFSLASHPATAQDTPATRVPRIGCVSPASPGPTLAAFRQGLADAGHVEGKTYVLDTRLAEGNVARISALVDEVLQHRVDVLLAGASAAALAAKRATTTVPVVFAGLYDPVGPGIVSSLARPRSEEHTSELQSH